MAFIAFKNRFIHSLPGRLRIEVYGLKANPSFAHRIENFFQENMCSVTLKASPSTGRVLLTYDTAKVSAETLCQQIGRLEEAYYMEQHPECRLSMDEQAVQEAATTLTFDMDAAEAAEIPEQFRAVPVEEPEKKERLPLALTASVVGLGVLGTKQLLMGKSPLAHHVGLFSAAGILSVLSGYPIFKKGFERFSRERRINEDLVLGAAALSFALVRENLVVLASISAIQYLRWQRDKQEQTDADPALYLTTQTKTYANRVTKLGFGVAAASLLLTRSPLVALGVLLAANPRPCLAAEEYTWKTAELRAQEQGLPLPASATLCQIAESKQLVVEDTELLFSGKEEVLHCTTREDESDVWHLAANLLEKTNHPLKQTILAKTDHAKRTKRSVHQLKETKEGITGKINRQDVLFGSKGCMQKYKIPLDEYEFEAKALEKRGEQVYFLASQGKCLGIISYAAPYTPKKYAVDLENALQQFPDRRVCFLRDSIGVLSNHGAEAQASLLVTAEHLAQMQQENVPYLMVTAERYASGQPNGTIHIDELGDLKNALESADKAEQLTKQHRKWTALWNAAGTALVIPGRIAAPFANLIADVVKLLWISRSASQLKNKTSRLKGEKLAGSTAVSKKQDMAWHAISDQELLAQLHTDKQSGLDTGNIKQLQAIVGLNRLQTMEKSPWFVRLIKQFKEFTNLVLLSTVGLSFVSGDIFDGVAMLAVLVANAVTSTIQEQKAEKVVEELNQFQPPICKVIRSGSEQEVSSEELVPGDLVVLEAGDLVPADIRILSEWNLEVNESALTGESMAVKKAAGVQPAAAVLADRTNMVYMGTNITRGKLTGVVVDTGMNTEIGYLSSLLKDEEHEMTPLQERVTSISKKFVKGAFCVGAIVLGVGLLRGNTIQQMISTSVALISSAIPEGLPVTITIALSAGIRRMSKRNAVIRRLSALETLGRVSVICSDKTGTLTKNEMTVTRIATVNEEWTVTGEGYAPEGEIIHQSKENSPLNEDIEQLIRIGVLCNNSEVNQEEGRWSIKGDPTEGALLIAGGKGGMYPDQLSHWVRKREIPFDSYHGTMSVICHEADKEDECYIISKGSVEATLKRCDFYQKEGKTYPLTQEIREKILKQNESFAADALRVLGFAYRPLDQAETCEQAKDQGLIYVGMVGMIDPPKLEAAQAIVEALQLGVKPVMITGDHPITAIAIGRQLGIYREGDRVLTGSELNELHDEELERLVSTVSIFARVSPEHKLRIVRAYQKTGQIVAMTGDGVNDAPAIKKADVGIAMGKTGTEVTKQTADMVLKEDHFGSIVDGVKEGRTIISNIRNAIGCLLTGNLAEIIVSSVAVIAGLPIPLVPVQILLMNLLTDALPAAVLAVNPGNKELVTERQDIVDGSLYKKVIVRGGILAIGALALFASSLSMGASLPVARTMAFATLVAGQLIQTFSWRQEKGQPFSQWIRDKFFIGALGISWLAFFSVIYVPGIAQVFHTAPLQLHQLLQVLLVGGSVSLLSKPLIKRTAGLQPPLSMPVVQAA